MVNAAKGSRATGIVVERLQRQVAALKEELDAALAAVFLGIQKVGKNKEYPCERRRVVAFESPTHLCCDIDTDVRMLLRFLL